MHLCLPSYRMLQLLFLSMKQNEVITSSTVYSWLSLAVKKNYVRCCFAKIMTTIISLNKPPLPKPASLLLAVSQLVQTSSLTYSLVYDHVTIPVEWGAGISAPSVWIWEKFSVHIVGNWSAHDSWLLIIRPCINIHLCCCLATKTWWLFWVWHIFTQ